MVVLVLLAPRVFADPAELLLERLDAAIATADDYQVRISTWVRSGRIEERRIVDLSYRAPDLLRIDVVEGSRFGDTGSVAILSADEVTARPGLRFVPIAVTYPKEHPRVSSVRGRAIDDAHLPVMADRIRRDVDAGSAVVRLTGSYFVFESGGAGTDGAIRERLFFDRETGLPIHHESREGEALVEYVDWGEFLVNRGIPETIFSVDLRREALREFPAALLAARGITDRERSALGPGAPWGPSGP
jgi:outer membrane lipoprotein-sorting protein